MPIRLPGQAGRTPSSRTRSGLVLLNYPLVIIGDTAGSHIVVDADGVRVKDGETVLSDLAPAALTLGDTSSGEYVDVSASEGVRMYSGGDLSIQLQPDGDVFVGSDISAPATTYFSVFANGQTYNSESVGAGDMLIGNNSSGKANLFYDASAGTFLIRGGTTTAVSIGTDGSLETDTVMINQNGISVLMNDAGALDAQNAYRFVEGGGTAVGGLYGSKTNSSPDLNRVQLWAQERASHSSRLAMVADSPTGFDAVFEVQVTEDGGAQGILAITADASETRANGTYEGGDFSFDESIMAGFGIYVGGNLSDTPSAFSLHFANRATGNDPRISFKDTFLIIEYDDSGTTRYKYLDLSGTGTSWSHSTTEP